MSNDEVEAVHQAFQSNNEAARLIHSQCYEEAISVLTRLMRNCQNIVRKHAADDADPQPTVNQSKFLSLDYCMKASSIYARCYEDDERGERKKNRLRRETTMDYLDRDDGDHVVPATDKLLLNQRRLSESSSQFIYDKPIEIPNELFDEELFSGIAGGYPTLRSCTMLSCIAAFNLALSYQLKHPRGPLEASSRKAARLYEICIALHENERTNVQSGTLFDLAVSNNLGIVFFNLNLPEKAKKFFQFSLSALMLILNDTRRRSNENDIQREDIDGFLRNVTIAMSMTRVAAAA